MKKNVKLLCSILIIVTILLISISSFAFDLTGRHFIINKTSAYEYLFASFVNSGYYTVKTQYLDRHTWQFEKVSQTNSDYVYWIKFSASYLDAAYGAFATSTKQYDKSQWWIISPLHVGEGYRIVQYNTEKYLDVDVNGFVYVNLYKNTKSQEWLIPGPTS